MRNPVDDVFAALADPTRREILRAVIQRSPITATALARDLPISRQAVAKHLAVLHEAGLVNSHRRGRETLFEGSSGPLTTVTDWVASVSRQWDRRLVQLRTRLEPNDHPISRRP